MDPYIIRIENENIGWNANHFSIIVIKAKITKQ